MRERFSDVARPTGMAALPPPPRKLPVLNGRLHVPVRTSPQTHFWESRPPISAKSIYRIASSIRKITVIKQISTMKRFNLQFEENVSLHLFTFASEHRSVSSGLGWAARQTVIEGRQQRRELRHLPASGRAAVPTGDVVFDVLKEGRVRRVWSGQMVALISPSGPGKSTLLDIASLLEHQNAGEKFIHDMPSSSLSDGERTVFGATTSASATKAYYLLGEFTAPENIILPQMIRGLPRKQGKAHTDELLSNLGLKTGCRTGRQNCSVASSSVSPSPARSPTHRFSCSPINRPAT